jgi:hypothetical protein
LARPGARAALALAGLAGSAAALPAGCAQSATESAAGGGAVEVAPAEAKQGLTSAMVCTTIVRPTGSAGVVYDAQIKADKPTTVYNNQTMNAGPAGAAERQALVYFDLSSIPSGPNTNIVTATLNLAQSTATTTGPGSIDVHRVTAPWVESQVTWQSFAGAFDPTVVASMSNASLYPATSVQSLVQAWVRGTTPNQGLLLREATNMTTFWTSEIGNPYQQPNLYVCYTLTCNPGFADCNNNGLDGCETSLGTSAANCGACGHACNLPNAAPACAAGACAVGACNLGFGDCNGSAADGCETLLTTNANCGACGAACALPNGAASCATGTCALTGCNAGFFDCDGNPQNGCEPLPCVNGSRCATGAGCSSGVCTGGFCAAPVCSDGTQNGAETDVDCGGGSCPPCAVGQSCALGSDCATSVCASGTCQAAACNDHVQNGAETDVDCGGSCAPCAQSLHCLVGADCQTGVCTAGVCQAPACNDGVKNGAETAVDCGGSCPACVAGKACNAGADCVDLVCHGGVCQLARCTDGVKNGAETDVDCGGTCPVCPDGEKCATSADCANGVCNGGTCQPSTCNDGVKNGNETGIDCGGSCAKPEVCNGFDDDCNGQIDEGLGTTTCGVGACQRTVQNCLNGAPQTCVPGLPQAEICDGLIDDDCDGVVDNGCACVDGQIQDCYSGAVATLGVGVCQPGKQTCAHGQWGACTGEVTPSAETCDGLDNDCNGQVDDGLGQTVCGVGECQVAMPNCINGLPQACVPRAPGVETCDGLDNDCDGVVDNNLPSVTCGVGACQNTVPSCVNGVAQTCTPGTPSAETCDGVDNDCDGVVDNGNPGGNQPCGTGHQGACAAGTTACSNGQIVCNQSAQASAEACDGVDNDCNGAIDEGNPGGGVACATGRLGVCSAGVTACTNGGVVCAQTTAAVTEICDGLDNDCDGAVDNGNPGGGLACSTGKPGLCGAGTTACTGGAIVCNQNATAHAETCNGLDDNCDGTIDEGNPGGGLPCNTGKLGACAVGVTQCSAGGIICVQTVFPAAETCDGLDNDCDGTIDNGNPGAGAACSTGKLGICAAGTTVCSGGSLSCQQTSQPRAESCNGLDDDCDGTIDNGNPGGGVACSTGKLGVCAAGVTACSAGGIVCNQTTQPSTETCDGALDENCNGQIDEGCACTNGAARSCYTGAAGTAGVGVCHAGTQTCAGGQWGACVGQVVPGAETCDGVDNDCNGTIDDGLGTISCGVGACGRTVAACANGHANTCTPGAPTAETCDGVDNDCDGVVDNGNPGGGAACSTGKLGVCAAGTTACVSGALACTQTRQASPETCDGLDNNCDGTVDEGVKTTFYRDADGDGYGSPSVTTQACSVPAGYVTNSADCNDAAASVHPGAAETCNGVDDNCNGSIDEGVKTTFYRDADGDGYGNAAVTTQACSAPAGYVANSADCNDAAASVHPGAAETCNGVDDNCNGSVDEGVKTTFYRDADGDGYGSASVTTQACSAPAGYVANAADCNDGNSAIRPGATEVCDGVDNNCNGSVDEGNPGGGAACSTGQAGVCAAGTVVCSGGALTCARNQAPTAEVCDGLDNNCDGVADNGVGCRTGFYRAYSSLGQHLYTSSYTAATSNGYYVEYANYYYLDNSQLPGTTAWYYCVSGYHNFYATDPNCELWGPGARVGVVGYIATSQLAGTTPLYRCWQGSSGDHFYTTSYSEYLNALNALGYSAEGLIGYVFTSP